MSPKPAAFFDRDGVINVSPGAGYVLRWEEFRFAEGSIEALQVARKWGYSLVLITSQQCVGKGLISQQELDLIHQNMQNHLRRYEAEFDLILACTHLHGTCTCRKPSPEMIFTAQKQLNLDLSRSFLIGDHERDIQMAHNAQVAHTIRILSADEQQVGAEFTLGSTTALPALLRELLPHWQR